MRTLSIYWEPAPTEVSNILCFFRLTFDLVKDHVLIVDTVKCISSTGPVLVITEYCSLGDLLNFLRQAETLMSFATNVTEIMENSIDYKNICDHKQFIRRYASKRV